MVIRFEKIVEIPYRTSARRNKVAYLEKELDRWNEIGKNAIGRLA